MLTFTFGPETNAEIDPTIIDPFLALSFEPQYAAAEIDPTIIDPF